MKILSRAGKANSKKWGRSYNVEDVDTGEVYWLNLDEWEVENEKDIEVGLLGERERRVRSKKGGKPRKTK